MRRLLGLISVVFVFAFLVALASTILSYFKADIKVAREEPKTAISEADNSETPLKTVNAGSQDLLPVASPSQQQVLPDANVRIPEITFDVRLTNEQYEKFLNSFFKSRRQMVDAVSEDLAKSIVKISKEYDFNPIFTAVIAANMSGLDATFQNEEGRLGFMGVTKRMLEVAKQVGGFKDGNEDNLKDPNFNFALALSIFKLLEESSGSDLSSILIAYRSNLETVEQLREQADKIPDTAKRYAEVVTAEFREAINTFNSGSQVEALVQNEESPVTKVLQQYNIKLANQIDFEQELSAQLKDLDNKSVAMAIYICSWEANPEHIGFYFTETDFELYQLGVSQRRNTIANLKAGFQKYKDIYNFVNADLSKVILAYFLGKVSYQELILTQTAIPENTLKAIERAKQIQSEIAATFGESVLSIAVPAASESIVDPQSIMLNFVTAQIGRHIVDGIAAENLAKKIITTAEKYNLPALLLTSLIQSESLYKSDIVSKEGKIGLLQIDPQKAARLADLVQVTWTDQSSLSDPDFNLDFGSRLLALYSKAFNNKFTLMIASHLIGGEVVLDYIDKQQDLPVEVVKFTADVLSRYQDWNEYLTKAIQAKPPATSETKQVAEVQIETPASTPENVKASYFKNSVERLSQIIADETYQTKDLNLAGAIVLASDKVAVDSLLVAALIKHSSNFGIKFSEDGNGLFNLTAERAEKIAQYSSVTWEGDKGLRDVDYSLRLATSFIAKLSTKFNSDQTAVIAAFFMGPAKVAKSYQERKTIPVEAEDIVNKVTKTYKSWSENYRIKKTN